MEPLTLMAGEVEGLPSDDGTSGDAWRLSNPLYASSPNFFLYGIDMVSSKRDQEVRIVGITGLLETHCPLGCLGFLGFWTWSVHVLRRRSHLSHLLPGASVGFREHLALAEAHCAQAVPHFVVWMGLALALDSMVGGGLDQGEEM